jgi:hypothetical protein
MIGNAANIYGSYMYPASEGPRYVAGGTANTIICLATAVMAGVLRWIHIRENKKLERAEEEAAYGSRSEAIEDENQEKRAIGFRYVI